MDRPTPTGPAAPDLRIVESRVYRGGNIWSYDPSIHLVVDLGVLEGYPTDTLPGFTDRLVELLPGLENHTCSKGVQGRLRRAAARGHLARPRRPSTSPCSCSRRPATTSAAARPAQVKGRTGVYNVIYGYTNEEVGAGGRARSPCAWSTTSCRRRRASTSPTELETFLTRAERTAFGPSTGAILEEAVSRDIPFIRLNSGSLVQLGQGVHQQRIRATMTSKTGALAVDIAGDKDMTTKLLGSAGLPVPKQETVRSAEGAVAAARRIGFPVVVKPLDGNHGRGVCLNLESDDEVAEAFAVAEDQSRRGYVIVESFVTGRDYRCLIVGGRMQAIAERVPAHVTGDGTHTVGELVEHHQRRPAPRGRAREGADQDQGRRGRAGAARASRATRSTTCRPPTRWSSSP